VTEWMVTVNVASPQELPEETLVELDEQADTLSGGSVSSRGLDGPGFTLRCTVPAPTLMRAIDSVVGVAERLFAYVPDATLVGATGETAELAERHAFAPDTPELLAATDVAELLRVSRQRVHQLQARADFPAPYARLGAGPIWTRPAIEAFARTWTRKPGRPTGVVVSVKDGCWTVKKQGDGKAISWHATRKEAMAAARKVARKNAVARQAKRMEGML
jgi:hypothetical protein